MTSQDLFFTLLRAALWDKPFEHTDATREQYAEALAEAKAQTVAGLVAAKLIEANVPLGAELAMECYSLQISTQKGNVLMDKELSEFATFMAKRELPFMVVKGQIVAQNYPQPDLRMCGDIDLYCQSAHYERVHQALSKHLNLQIGTISSDKHVEFEVNHIHYELHYYLSDLSYPPHVRYFNQVADTDKGELVKVGATVIPTLSPTLNAAFIFVHIFDHLVTSGIGFRQVCDLALYLHKRKDAIDAQLLQKHLTQIGLYKMFCALGYVMVNYLGLAAADFPFPLVKRDKRYGEMMLANILKMGNFGRSYRNHCEMGLKHSLITAFYAVKQSSRFLLIAPMEVLFLIPRMTIGFFRRNTHH